nr:MAG TPA: hypothetical protein [Caudoviricetes sp.]
MYHHFYFEYNSFTYPSLPSFMGGREGLFMLPCLFSCGLSDFI